MIRFKTLNTVSSAIALALFLSFLLYPKLPFYLFGISGSESAFFVARRLAVLFLGLCVLTWISRNAQPSDSRQAICASIGVSMLCMAILGAAELVRGFAGPGILVAVTVEVLLSFFYFKIWLCRKQVAPSQ